MKIGIYVGSFNPVHIGHIDNINYLLNKYLDKVYVVPCMNYWNKNNLIDLKHRINMLKYIENPRICIDTINNELEYTYLLLREYNKIYKKEEIYLIIGADNIIKFNEWKNYKYLLKLNLIICKRDNIDIKYYLDKLNKKDKYFIVDSINDISSTLIRNNIDNNKLLTKYIDKEVLDYIRVNNLYRE